MLKKLTTSVFIYIFLISNITFALEPKKIIGNNLLILENMTLIDGTGSAPKEHAVIVIQDSRIIRIGTVGDFVYPASAKIQQLNNRFIMPGLIDVHTHIQSPVHEVELKMLLAYGVTSIRIPGGTNVGVKVKNMIEQGKMIGPRVFTGGRTINGVGSDDFVVHNEAEMRAEVRRQHATGVDLVKFYYALTPDLVATGIDEAHKLGIPAIGHLSKTTWTSAAESGIDALLHSDSSGPVMELISAKQRQKFAKSQNLSLAEFDNQPHSVWQLVKLVGEPIETAGQRIYDYIDIDGPETNRLIKALLTGNVMIDPTLVAGESVLFGDEVTRILSHLETDKMPKSVADWLWGEGWEKASRFWNDENKSYFTSLRPLFKLANELTLKLFNSGVLIGAGSDVGMPWMTPGASLHRELELLVEAGISVKDVIQIATKNGSQFVYNSNNVGTIETGKLADILVLTANPLEDIKNTRTIEMVIKSGIMYNPKSLLEEVHNVASQSKFPAFDDHH